MKLPQLTVLALGLAACAAQAQTIDFAIAGGLTNFDAANYEGKDAYGFEIQIEGLKPTDLGQAWTGNKYGNPVVVPYATGVYVRYQSPWDPVTQQFTAKTVPKAPGTSFVGTCYMVGPSYLNAGCDHFGPRPFVYNYTVVGYRWLLADPANPGQLVASPNNLFVPTPVYTWVPPAVPTNPPVLVVEVNIPPPPAAQYGDATWMKVYKTELGRSVTLDELVDTNPAVVPEAAAQLETSWKLMQASPPGGRKQRGRHANQGSPNAGTRAVVRRYETYAYTGAYDPVTHEAVCGGDGSCNAPLTGELGDLLTAQMAAANIVVPSITVTKVGSGGVASAEKNISCGSKCAAAYANGTVVTLAAAPASNNVFVGWGGACSGAATICSVTVNDALNVTANFAAAPAGGGGGGAGGGGGGGGGGSSQVTLQVGRVNAGTVTSNIGGIACGSSCSASLVTGAVVTLTATPSAGKTFTGWSGACTGTAPSCTLTMSTKLSVQASFSK